jgi:putative transcriptional regulator
MEKDREIIMAKRSTYRSDTLRSAHLAAKDLHAVGAVDKATMRRFDKACLTDVEEMAPTAIQRIRNEAGMSQTVFALTLNVTPSLVSQWERGEKKPSGPSLKLLNLADKKGVEAIF